MTTPILAALASLLRSKPRITSLLGAGANSIILTGRMVVDDTTQFPLVSIQDAGDFSAAYRLPLTERRINFRVYDVAPAPNKISYRRIDEIVQELIQALDRNPNLTIDMSYEQFIDIYFDNYISADMWDDVAKMPYKVVRFCIYTARRRYGPP